MELVKKGILIFNQEIEYSIGDRVIESEFASPPDRLSHFKRVVLLDSLFKTNLARSKPSGGHERRTIYEISEGIRELLPEIEQILSRLSTDDLMGLDLDGIYAKAVANCVRLVMSNCHNNSISFSTKYLHFLKPRLFAPWDTVVPQSIQRYCPNIKIRGGDVIQRYLALLQAHQKLWASFDHQQQEDIMRYDETTQPAFWCRINTPVRILDKALWALGK